MSSSTSRAWSPASSARTLNGVRVANPFLVRTVEPSIGAAAGRRVRALRRIGKRIAIGLEDELYLVVHLMIAGRLHWKEPGASLPKRRGLAAFDFPGGTLTLTEAGSKRRASLHVIAGEGALAALDPGGVDVMDADLDTFARVLTKRNHTLKRALTDPHVFSGIGNAYSDEILHRARLSPVKLTERMAPDEIARLHAAARRTLTEWTERLRAEAGEGFPEKVTAFRPDMGRPRTLRRAVPGLRRPGPAYRPRRSRDQLLRALPDRRQALGRPRAVAPAEEGLAPYPRRAGEPTPFRVAAAWYSRTGNSVATGGFACRRL